MSKHTLLDAEAILKRAQPLTHQQAHEIQPFGHLVRMPIALSDVVAPWRSFTTQVVQFPR